MFDTELNPLFNDPNSEAFKQLQWLQDAKVKHGIMAFGSTHETKVAVAMNTGQHAFSVMYNYMLAAMNNPPSRWPASSTWPPCPAPSTAPLGFAKFYCMTTQAAKDPKRRAASWKLIESFGGGDYKVAKRWAVEKGLGFAALPLFDDPDVKKAWATWIDMEQVQAQAKLAVNGTQTEWMGMWSEFFRPLLAKAIERRLHREGSHGRGRQEVERVQGTARADERLTTRGRAPGAHPRVASPVRREEDGCDRSPS